MRAISQQTFGGPEVLRIAEVERPPPLPTEVLVRVCAVGVNPVDTSIRSGAWPLLGNPPFVLGWDISGIVEQTGAGVTRFRPGDEVYGMPYFPRAVGAYAEFVVASSRQLAYKPARLDHRHSAALPLAGLTAWQGLVDAGQLEDGQRVLIHGGGGGVGHLAVQIAKARGAHVTATVSRSKRDFVRRLGADEVLDYRAVDFAREVGDLDVVLDLVGGDYGAPRWCAGDAGRSNESAPGRQGRGGRRPLRGDHGGARPCRPGVPRRARGRRTPPRPS